MLLNQQIGYDQQIAGTNTGVDNLEIKAQQALHEPDVRLESKYKDLRVECKKEFKDTCKQVVDNLDGKTTNLKKEQEEKIKVVQDIVSARTVALEARVEETAKSTTAPVMN